MQYFGPAKHIICQIISDKTLPLVGLINLYCSVLNNYSGVKLQYLYILPVFHHKYYKTKNYAQIKAKPTSVKILGLC